MFNNFGQFQSPMPMSSYSQIAGQFSQQQANPYPGRFQQQTNITFVNGIEGAKAFQLSPNSNALLMDSDNSKFYVKSTDNLGVAKVTSYSFTEDEVSQASPASSQNSEELLALGKQMYDQLTSKIGELESKVSELTTKLETALA